MKRKLKILKIKIKNWLKAKLIKLLELDEIEKKVAYNSQDLKYINSKQQRLEGLLNIGVDISNYNEENWAVVCLKGKPEYIKFFQFNKRDTRYFLSYLKHFEKANITIDAPVFYGVHPNRRSKF